MLLNLLWTIAHSRPLLSVSVPFTAFVFSLDFSLHINVPNAWTGAKALPSLLSSLHVIYAKRSNGNWVYFHCMMLMQCNAKQSLKAKFPTKMKQNSYVECGIGFDACQIDASCTDRKWAIKIKRIGFWNGERHTMATDTAKKIWKQWKNVIKSSAQYTNKQTNEQYMFAAIYVLSLFFSQELHICS